jgi:intracellular multiplication protein IcmS
MGIESKLALIADDLKINFTLNGKVIPKEDVFTELGLFPAIMRRADQLSSFCLTYGLGIDFDSDSEARLGVICRFSDAVPDSFRILCATEIFYELIEAATDKENIPLDDLMYD